MVWFLALNKDLSSVLLDVWNYLYHWLGQLLCSQSLSHLPIWHWICYLLEFVEVDVAEAHAVELDLLLQVISAQLIEFVDWLVGNVANSIGHEVDDHLIEGRVSLLEQLKCLEEDRSEVVAFEYWIYSFDEPSMRLLQNKYSPAIVRMGEHGYFWLWP